MMQSLLTINVSVISNYLGGLTFGITLVLSSTD